MEIFGSVPFSKLLTSNFTPRLQELFLEMCHSLRNLTGVAILPEGIIIYMRKTHLTLRSGDTLTNDRIGRWCYC